MDDPKALKAKQEKLLGKLQWLIDRSKVGFKGNQPPFAPRKTSQSVKQAKKREEKELAGDIDFRPFWHGTVPLAADATKRGVVRQQKEALTTTFCEPDRDVCRNAFKQAIDKATGRPELESIIQWRGQSGESFATGKRFYPHSFSRRNPLQAPPEEIELRPTLRDVEMASALQRVQLIRKEEIDHPKFTAGSTSKHEKAYWDPMTQLPAQPILLPPKRQEHPLELKRNSVRMISILRRTSGTAASWK
jgi:hypothetical protein